MNAVFWRWTRPKSASVSAPAAIRLGSIKASGSHRATRQMARAITRACIGATKEASVICSTATPLMICTVQNTPKGSQARRPPRLQIASNAEPIVVASKTARAGPCQAIGSRLPSRSPLYRAMPHKVAVPRASTRPPATSIFSDCALPIGFAPDRRPDALGQPTQSGPFWHFCRSASQVARSGRCSAALLGMRDRTQYHLSSVTTATRIAGGAEPGRSVSERQHDAC